MINYVDEDDVKVINVVRDKGDVYDIVNTLVGKEAEDIYKKLTTQN